VQALVQLIVQRALNARIYTLGPSARTTEPRMNNARERQFLSVAPPQSHNTSMFALSSLNMRTGAQDI
jgi:hypothetical protein